MLCFKCRLVAQKGSFKIFQNPIQFPFGLCKIGFMGPMFSVLKLELIPCGLVYPQMGTFSFQQH